MSTDVINCARVAAVQMVSGRDLETNLEAAAKLIERAAKEGAQLIVLPEAFALFLASEQRELGVREASAAARIRPFVAELAAKYGVWIVGGTLPIVEADDPRPRAASIVFDDTGAEVARYDKLHLFDVEVSDQQGRYCESDTFCPGALDRVKIVPTPFGKLGLTVCYDLRFAELFQTLRDQGAEIFAVPSAFTLHTGLAHWLPLLRARAIETQSFVIGANQGGEHSAKRHTSGGSVIINSWGEVLAAVEFGEAVVIADIDLSKLRQERAAMPVAQHRRFGVTSK
jgi:predicted amidohydrolase